MEMREKVARAIHPHWFYEGAAQCYRDDAFAKADAVLDAMMEPTEEMKRAGAAAAEREIYATGGGEWGDPEASLLIDGEVAIWSAMIAAAKAPASSTAPAE